MKIEMGESLFYSWLRHVKECQIVQTNWKPSPQWISFEHEADTLMHISDEFFHEKYGYHIYKENRSAAQLLQQAECDVLGLSFFDGIITAYAIDVAFHEAGLNYGDHEETVTRVIKKCLRTAMCLRSYFQVTTAEIIFAAPKIRAKEYGVLIECVHDMNELLKAQSIPYRVRLIANEEFEDRVLQPILLVSESISDTSELFLRSYQLYGMFANQKKTSPNRLVKKEVKQEVNHNQEPVKYAEQKVGAIANHILRRMLEEGAATAQEIMQMQEKDYSRHVFHLNFPLLVRDGAVFDRVRYYSKTLQIGDTRYYLCSQWVERPENNDRPYLLKWIEEHGGFA